MATGGESAGHGKPKCGAKKKQGPGQCTRPAGWGTDHPGIGCCKFHGGSTPNHRRSAQLEQARIECNTLGIQVEVSAEESLIRAVWEAEGNLAFYRAQVQQLAADAAVPADGLLQPKMGAAGKDGDLYTVELIAHPLVTLYHEAEERRHRVSSSVAKLGIEERRVRLAEKDATRILSAQVATLKAMGLGDRLEEFRREFVARLQSGPVPASLGAR